VSFCVGTRTIPLGLAGIIMRIKSNIFMYYMTLSTQIFIGGIPPPLCILYDLLKKISVIQDAHYVFDLTAFKKGEYMAVYDTFMCECIKYYIPSRRYYCERRPHTFATVATIFRHICKAHNSHFIICPVNEYNGQTNVYKFPC